MQQHPRPEIYEKPSSGVVTKGEGAPGEALPGATRPARDRRLVGHVPVLDGVRGIAISMVLALHFIANAQPVNGFERALSRALGFGELGVDLFFVLSGFLITGTLIEAKGRTGYFRNFYMRRTLRIFPLYYAVLVVLLLVAPRIPFFAGPELDTLRAEQGWAWLYGVNILSAIRGHFGFPYIDHFWSLAVEEHFYFFWPLVVWACSRRSLVGVSASVALLSVTARAIAATMHVNDLALYVLTPFRLDALCLGAFLAAYARGAGGLDGLRRAIVPTLLATVAVFGGSYVLGRAVPWFFLPTHQVRLTLFAILFAALVVIALTTDPRSAVGRTIGMAPLRFLGKYSYGLYVFHHFFSYYMMTRDTASVVARVVGSHTLAVLLQAAVGTGASLGVAMLSYHFFEKRFLALKRFWEPAAGARSGGSET